MSTVSSDLRYALRSLRRAPWFSVLAVLMLALGIGLNTALFSMLDAVVWRALPLHEPHRLVEIFGQEGARSGMRVPVPIVEALRTRASTLAGLTLHGPVGGALRTADGPVGIRGDHAWSNFTEVMGVRPALGRGFLPDDEHSDAAPVMLVSHGFWRRFLNADTAAVGRTLYVDAVPYTVIGVMPATFRTQFRGDTNEHYWTTHVSEQVRLFELEEGYELFARLAPNVSIEQAQREVAAIAASVDVPAWGGSAGERRLGMRALSDEVVGDSARVLHLSFAAVVLVLLIICANLALLLLARSDRRLAEFATRKAMGASATQLLRLALADSLLIAVIGGAAGAALAYWLLPLLVALAPAEIPRLAEATINARVLTLATLLTILTACGFGSVPALRLSRVSVTHALNRAGMRVTGAGASLRSALVFAQITAAVILCVVAGLVGRTFVTLLPVDLGFEPRSLFAFVTYMDPRLYPDPADRYHRLTELVIRLEATPGVTAAGLAQDVPFSGDDNTTIVRDVARTDAAQLAAERRAISPNYFELLDIPVPVGRTFTRADGPTAPRVAIVNQTLARQLDATGDVIGKTVRAGRAADAPTWEIVGVAADTRSSGTTLDVQGELYVPLAQIAPSIAFIVVQAELETRQVTAAIRREIRAVAPELPLRTDQAAVSIDEWISRSLAGPRFLAALSTAFSVVALLLAAIGVFGLVAYSVVQRRREFGIRAAVGARPRDLASNAIGSVTGLSAAAVLTGLAAAAYATRLVESQLYAVERFDLPTFAVAALVMLLVTICAAVVPARRAAALAPMTVLRED